MTRRGADARIVLLDPRRTSFQLGGSDSARGPPGKTEPPALTFDPRVNLKKKRASSESSIFNVDTTASYFVIGCYCT